MFFSYFRALFLWHVQIMKQSKTQLSSFFLYSFFCLGHHASFFSLFPFSVSYIVTFVRLGASKIFMLDLIFHMCCTRHVNQLEIIQDTYCMDTTNNSHIGSNYCYTLLLSHIISHVTFFFFCWLDLEKNHIIICPILCCYQVLVYLEKNKIVWTI